MEVGSHEQENTDEDKSPEMSNNENANSYADDDDDDAQNENNNHGSVSGTTSNLSLTSFLFGNIDAYGQLEGDVFDPECKRYLASLSRLGLASLVRQVTNDGDYDDDDDDDDEDEDEDEQEEEGALVKSPSAIDYSDINELVEDEIPTSNDDLEKATDYNGDVKSRLTPIGEDDEEEKKTDSELMPPPPPPAIEDSAATDSTNSAKPNTPLAAMLPPKYANVDVKEFFPDFRQDSVLRFSRLFGPGKQAHLPKIWKHVKKKKKKKLSHQKSHDNQLNNAHNDIFEEKLNSGEMEAKNDQSFKFLDDPPTVGFDLNFAPNPDPSECISDDETVLCKPADVDNNANAVKGEGEKSKGNKNGPKEADWRFGPAQLWYDMLGVPATGDGFDYGFKVIKEYDSGDENMKDDDLKDIKPAFNEIILSGSSPDEGYYDGDNEEEKEFPDDAFHMLTQYNWEEDIIWNGDDTKHKLNQKRKNMAAGWVPSSYNRTAQAFSQPGKSTIPFTSTKKDKKSYSSKGGSFTASNNTSTSDGDDTWYSIFPVENEELVYDKWENDIIWDPDNMDKIPEPKVLTLDPNDENIILGIPEDVDPSTLQQGNEAPVKVKIPHPHVKKSKILLGKAGVITTIEEESPPPPPKSPDKDPFNLSNDEYYQAKSTEQTIKMGLGGGLLQHSTPVVELQPPFVPTYMGEKKLRLFHRPPLKHYSHGALAQPGSHPVHPLTKEIKKKAKQREQERLASGGGDVFFMRTPEDLTGKDGDIILVEYCEEYPPLLSQVGMCTRVKNYYKRRIGNDKGPPEYRFGETSYAHTSPFLGSMHPGQSIQTLENNMYRAPIYEHQVPSTDFLVIRTRNGYSIREIDSLFCLGQECPLYEVPGPNSKRANNFIRDFLQVFIYRLFWKSKDSPRRIKMDEIKRAYPAHSESSIRKRLKPCADFKRTGVDSNWWVIKPEFRLPTEDEIRAMVSPEQCSSFFSMLAAEQRLKDAGYGDKFLSALEDDNDDDTQKLDDEIKVAPWHTTRAYIQAVKGKCLLQLTGPADPTGCGEGFSYIRIPNKPTQNKEEQDQQPKRTVTGTDADLRKLSLNDAKNLLRNYGVPEEEIKKLTRWEVIDVVRTLSTEKAKAGEEGMNKFSRGNRFSIAEHQERYKEECQRIFDLQNRVLASEEVLSTDEGSSEEEENDSDMEEKGKYIENILANKKTSSQMTLEKEEQERKELQKMIMGEDDKDDRKKNPKKDDEDSNHYGYGTAGRLLRITRTFKSADGKEYTRVETVRKTAVIDTYVKIRTTKDDAFIRNFAGQLDEVQKEEIKRERRRLQEQLRRIKRNQERLQKGIITPPKTKKPKLKPDLKLKCGACGQVGHMRTNKACPMYSSMPGPMPQPVSMTSTSEEHEEGPAKHSVVEEPDELVNVDGTKIKLSSKVMKQAEELKKRSMHKGSKDQSPKNARRKRAGTVVHCDYLKRKNKSVNRRRIDPVITLSTIFEEILNEMRDMPDVQPFLFPVNAKQVPDYYNVVHHPMDLSTIRDNLRQKKYQSREEFLSDINQIVENSKLYNGVNSTLTATSERMLSLCIDRFADKEEKLMRLEKAINPLLDDDDQVAFDYILDSIVNTKLFTMQESWPFMKPVNKKNVKDYYEIIQQPMDLQTIAKKVKNHKYHSRGEFMHDVELILMNSEKYNGLDSSFTQKAKILVQFCRDSLAEYGAHLEALEKKIAIAQERAMEQAEVESLAESGGPDEEGNYTYPESENANPSGVMDSLIEQETDYYGDDEEHVNVDVVAPMNQASLPPEMKKTPKGSKTTPRSRKKKEKLGEPPTKRACADPRSRNLLEEDLEFSEDDDDENQRIQHLMAQANLMSQASLMSQGAVMMPHDSMMLAQGNIMIPQGGMMGGDGMLSHGMMISQIDPKDLQYQNLGYVQEPSHEESRVEPGVDEGYDPSVAFIGGMMERKDDSTINNDLAVSDSDDEEGCDNLLRQQQQEQPPPEGDDDDRGGLWF